MGKWYQNLVTRRYMDSADTLYIIVLWRSVN